MRTEPAAPPRPAPAPAGRPRPRRYPRLRPHLRRPGFGIRARAAAAALLAALLAFTVAAPLVGAAVRARLDRVALGRAQDALHNVAGKIPAAPDEWNTGYAYAVIADDGRWLRSSGLVDPRQWGDPAAALPPVRDFPTPRDVIQSYDSRDLLRFSYPKGHAPDSRMTGHGDHPYRFLRVRVGPFDTEELDRYANGYRNDGFVPPHLPTQSLSVYVLVDPLVPEQTAATVTRVLLWYVSPAASLFVALIAWLVTWLALRPVELIRRQMAAVRGGAFHERVPVPRARDGVRRLARTTNATLDRLEHALDEQRRLVADASHELRSPLAGLRASLEVPLAHPAGADWPAVVGGALRDTERLQELADDLLLLARAEPAQARPDGPALARATVDLPDLVAEQVAEQAFLKPELAFTTELGESAAAVPGREVLLARLVRNLLDNAVRHARAEVTVTLAVDGARQVVLTVEDDGPGIPEPDRERVFERFVRLDDARDRERGGAGLGLALVRTIAQGVGGTAAAEAPGRLPGARLVVRLPLASG
ncbi:sensor histidine kinase [Kitasatospora sp. NPDC057198]|uniref:sensor histidine kinase n=1 Tax=Kitasatospora sp. NPDC057198 TaxID=3346046 RepID=UPI00364097DA